MHSSFEFRPSTTTFNGHLSVTHRARDDHAKDPMAKLEYLPELRGEST